MVYVNLSDTEITSVLLHAVRAFKLGAISVNIKFSSNPPFALRESFFLHQPV